MSDLNATYKKDVSFLETSRLSFFSLVMWLFLCPNTEAYSAPLSQDPSLQAAQALMSQGRHKEAKKILLGLLKRNPNHQGALLLLGQSAFEDGQVSKAGNYFLKVDSDKVPSSAAYTYGISLLTIGECRKATEGFRRVLNPPKAVVLSRFYAGVCYAKLQEWRTCLELLEPINTLPPHLEKVRQEALSTARSQIQAETNSARSSQVLVQKPASQIFIPTPYTKKGAAEKTPPPFPLETTPFLKAIRAEEEVDYHGYSADQITTDEFQGGVQFALNLSLFKRDFPMTLKAKGQGDYSYLKRSGSQLTDVASPNGSVLTVKNTSKDAFTSTIRHLYFDPEILFDVNPYFAWSVQGQFLNRSPSTVKLPETTKYGGRTGPDFIFRPIYLKLRGFYNEVDTNLEFTNERTLYSEMGGLGDATLTFENGASVSSSVTFTVTTPKKEPPLGPVSVGNNFTGTTLEAKGRIAKTIARFSFEVQGEYTQYVTADTKWVKLNEDTLIRIDANAGFQLFKDFTVGAGVESKTYSNYTQYFDTIAPPTTLQDGAKSPVRAEGSSTKPYGFGSLKLFKIVSIGASGYQEGSEFTLSQAQYKEVFEKTTPNFKQAYKVDLKIEYTF